jgi:hypothetical protein
MMAPIKLVYASATADIVFREQLSAHLHALVLKGLLSEWHEQLIPAGTDAASNAVTLGIPLTSSFSSSAPTTFSPMHTMSKKFNRR